MRTWFSTTRQVVNLDWRLMVRACRGGGLDLMLPSLLGTLVLATTSESAVATASVFAGRPSSIVAPVLSAFVWNTCLAAAFLTLAAGGHSTAERIVRYLAPEPITRRQTYVALVSLSLAGRHALVSGVVLVPLICLLAGLVDPARAAGGSLAMFFVVRLVPGVTRCMAALAGAATRPTTAVVIAAAGAVALVSGPSLEAVIATLPPSLVARYVVGSRTSQSLWVLLAAWTAAIGTVEYATLFRSPAPPVRLHAVAALPAIPGWMRGMARLARLPAPLLHAELLRLVRWRRFLLGWVVYATVLAFVLARMPVLDARVLPVLLVAIAPPFVVMATLGNLFAPDRAGVQAFFLTLDEPHAAVGAKLAAVAVFVAIAEVITLCLVFAFVEKQWQLADLYAPLMAVAFFLYLASTGRIVSTLFPAATDPRGLGGLLLGGPGAMLLLPLNGLGLMGIAAPALSHDTRGVSALGLLAAGVVISAFVAAAVLVSSKVSRRAMCVRREDLMARLSQESSLS
jgi:hypothetical protein